MDYYVFPWILLNYFFYYNSNTKVRREAVCVVMWQKTKLLKLNCHMEDDYLQSLCSSTGHDKSR